jgi:nucleotide-binding universal stress UspA family protein
MKKLKNWKIGKNVSYKYLFVRPLSVPMINYPQYQEAMRRIQDDLKKAMKPFIKTGAKTEIMTVDGNDPAEKISRIGHRYDVIAMAPHRHAGLLPAFGKVTAKVLRLSRKPVLIVKT